MGSLLRILIGLPIFKPLVRFLVGAIAIPLFRLCLKKIGRVQQLDAELEKDLEQWFRGSLVLLVATKNMEEYLFNWAGQSDGKLSWFLMAMRLMLAIGVTEAMPDQELFSVIHPGPPKLRFPRGRVWEACREQWWPLLKGLICQHLNRSSQVFAIMAVLFEDTVGWVCYTLAIVQYLIIGLVTSRDKALDVMSEFDKQVQQRRNWLATQLNFDDQIAEDDWMPVESLVRQHVSPSLEDPPQMLAAEPPTSDLGKNSPNNSAIAADRVQDSF